MRNDERRKLTAAWLNILAAGTVSTGAVTQLAAVSSGKRVGAAAVQGIMTALAFVLAGILLHVVARRLRDRMGLFNRITMNTAAPIPPTIPRGMATTSQARS